LNLSRAVAVCAIVMCGCAFTSQRPVPPGWQPIDDAPKCNEHLWWVAIDAAMSAAALTVGATDVGAGDDGRPTNYALLGVGVLHLASGAYGLTVRGRCKRAKVEASESAVGTLRQAERWWTRDQPCPEGATLEQDKYDGLQCKRPDGVLHGGTVKLAFRSETLRINEYHYRNGVFHGPFREWHYNTEQLSRQGELRDGALLLGSVRQWDRAGRAVTPNYGTGPVARWRGDTKLEEGAYVEGLPHGEWTIWNELGELIERGAFANGLRAGEWTTYRDGVMRERMVYEGGLEHGEVSRWSADGTLVETGSYWYGRPDSRWRYYGAAGLAMDGTFHNGERHGAWTYYAGGAKAEAGRFENGLREGVWTRWDTTGAVIDERSYRQGQLVGQGTP
jgi:antitoxin component YwqK of YwqJK toxin-antitoxin module